MPSTTEVPGWSGNALNASDNVALQVLAALADTVRSVLRREFALIDHEEVTQGIAAMATKSKATAEVFVTALRALSKPERDEVLVQIARDRALRHDLLDLATIAERQREPARTFQSYLEGRRR